MCLRSRLLSISSTHLTLILNSFCCSFWITDHSFAPVRTVLWGRLANRTCFHFQQNKCKCSGLWAWFHTSGFMKTSFSHIFIFLFYRYQDMRRQIGFEIRDMWYNLGEPTFKKSLLNQTKIDVKYTKLSVCKFFTHTSVHLLLHFLNTSFWFIVTCLLLYNVL